MRTKSASNTFETYETYERRKPYWKEHVAPVEMRAEAGSGLQYEPLVDISFFASLKSLFEPSLVKEINATFHKILQ